MGEASSRLGNLERVVTRRKRELGWEHLQKNGSLNYNAFFASETQILNFNSRYFLNLKVFLFFYILMGVKYKLCANFIFCLIIPTRIRPS